MALELSALATSVLPGPSLGRFGLQLGLEERTLSIVVVSPSDNRLQASASMVVAAIAMPNRPHCRKAKMMPAQMTTAGIAVASIDTARPWITFVP